MDKTRKISAPGRVKRSLHIKRRKWDVKGVDSQTPWAEMSSRRKPRGRTEVCLWTYTAPIIIVK